MRCGTTSLHELLRRQPGLCFPPKKEVHFFDKRNPELGTSVKRYAALFTSCAEDSKCGEATPDYLSTEGCDRFIHDLIPQAKLVIILRNPVQRTWSHYLFSEYKGVETLAFRAAIAEEAERLKIKSNHTDIFFSYLQRSRYMEHIERYEVLFGRDRLWILFLEELIHNPRSVVDDLLRFLGVHDRLMSDEIPHLNRVVKSHRGVRGLLHRLIPTRAMCSSDRLYLQSYFADHNARLSAWLGRALPWD